MAAEISESFPDATVRLVEGSGGAFEVVADGRPVFSKLEVGRHALEGEVVSIMQKLPGDDRR